MKTSIYTLTHKAFTPPTDKIYIPLRVGAAKGDDFGYLRDDLGDNISEKNDTFSELTGCYYVLKNDSTSDILGVCHYRRYLLGNSGSLLTESEINDILNPELGGYDLITTKELKLRFSYEYGFGKNHKPYYLEKLREAIYNVSPEYLDICNKLLGECHTYFGNMIIASADIFKAYHRWLFDVLFEMEKITIIEEEDSYHKRIFGFISEFLLYVYCRFNNLKVYETMVGMVGEKAEVIEIKMGLAKFLEAGDYMGAKRYFLDEYEKRPDILMEASDINNELHLSMEIISIAEHEADLVLDSPIISRGYSFDVLMDFARKLNEIAIRDIEGGLTEADEQWMEANKVSDAARFVSRSLEKIKD